MAAIDPLSRLLTLHLSKWLNARGFSRRGYSFVKRHNGNGLLVHFQVWKERSTAAEIIFTVNLGVLSKRLLWLADNRDPPKVQSIGECHWRERLGVLLPARRDYWWSVDDTRIAGSVTELEDALGSFGLPAMERVASDDDLRNLWLSGRSPGLTSFERLRYLSLLLVEIGPRSELDGVLAELRSQSKGMPWEQTAEQHIRRIDSMRATN
jgi:hypothetical protein